MFLKYHAHNFTTPFPIFLILPPTRRTSKYIYSHHLTHSIHFFACKPYIYLYDKMGSSNLFDSTKTFLYLFSLQFTFVLFRYYIIVTHVRYCIELMPSSRMTVKDRYYSIPIEEVVIPHEIRFCPSFHKNTHCPRQKVSTKHLWLK